jgi:hypothetical protein
MMKRGPFVCKTKDLHAWSRPRSCFFIIDVVIASCSAPSSMKSWYESWCIHDCLLLEKGNYTHKLITKWIETKGHKFLLFHSRVLLHIKLQASVFHSVSLISCREEQDNSSLVVHRIRHFRRSIEVKRQTHPKRVCRVMLQWFHCLFPSFFCQWDFSSLLIVFGEVVTLEWLRRWQGLSWWKGGKKKQWCWCSPWNISCFFFSLLCILCPCTSLHLFLKSMCIWVYNALPISLIKFQPFPCYSNAYYSSVDLHDSLLERNFEWICMSLCLSLTLHPETPTQHQGIAKSAEENSTVIRRHILTKKSSIIFSYERNNFTKNTQLRKRQEQQHLIIIDSMTFNGKTQKEERKTETMQRIVCRVCLLFWCTRVDHHENDLLSFTIPFDDTRVMTER